MVFVLQPLVLKNGSELLQSLSLKEFLFGEVNLFKANGFFYLEEQAVGDAMMFLSLVPDLLSTEVQSIFVSKRLLPIYKRTFDDLISSGKVSVCSKARCFFWRTNIR